MLLVKHGWMVVTIDARALVPVLRNAHNRKANWHVILTSYSKHHAVNVKDHVLKILIYMSKLLSFFMVDAPSTLIYPPIVARRRYLGNAVNRSRVLLVSNHPQPAVDTPESYSSSRNRKHRATQ